MRAGRYARGVSLVYCGIDEAGFGPMLGPLCVAMVALRVEAWEHGSPAPDLWAALAPTIVRGVKEARNGAIAVGDSKALKGANSCTTRHPLRHLERGVLAFAHASGRPWADDASLMEGVGGRLEEMAWQAGDPIALPLDWTAAELGIGANVLTRTLARAGVELLDLRCRVVGVAEFNATIERCGSKGATTELGLVEHLGAIRERWGGQGAVRVVCDRQSGRADYRDVMGRCWGEGVEELERSPRVSRYALGEGMGIQFLPEAETHHLPVALASMLAKLVRELSMMRFNRYWCARIAEIKPTAGYVQDGRRWMEEARRALTPDERRALVRIA